MKKHVVQRGLTQIKGVLGIAVIALVAHSAAAGDLSAPAPLNSPAAWLGWIVFVLTAPVVVSLATTWLVQRKSSRRGPYTPSAFHEVPILRRTISDPKSMPVGFSQSLAEGADLDMALAFMSHTQGVSRIMLQESIN